MRCLFTMFAEDVGLLPNRAFTQLLADSRLNVASFPPLAEELWRTMAHGGFSVALRVSVPHFDGGLFEDATALPLSVDQLQLLIEAAQADWRDVEPAIFGTLLVRALDPAERHKLGAHFTPRAYVERLVLPTIIEPLRAEWDAVKADALLFAEQGKGAEALTQVEAFQRRLANIRILDPACGSGNFLYVTLEHLKRLEGEVLEVRRSLGEGQMLLEMEGSMVRPEQFHGIEIDPLGRGHCRAGAVDRLPAVAPPHPRRFTPARADPAQPAQHRMPRRGVGLGRGRAAAGRRRPTRDPLGRPHHQAAPGHRPGGARRYGPCAGLALRQPAAGGVAGGGFCRGNPPFVGNKRMRALWAMAMSRPSALRIVTYPIQRTTSCTGGIKPRVWLRSSQLQRFGFITTNSPTSDLQPTSVGASPVGRDPDCRCCLPFLTILGWTAQMVQRCELR